MLEELELLDDQVVVIEEGLVDVLLDIVVQVWLDVERLVRLFDLLDPHVQLIELLVDEVLEVVGCVEDSVDAAHQEREEDEADELQHDREEQLVWSLAGVVTVPDSCNDFEDPIESKDVLGVRWLVGKSVGWIAVVDPTALAPITWILYRTTISLVAEIQPEAGVDMVGVDDAQNEPSEHGQISLTLFAQVLEHELQYELLRLRQSVDVADSDHLQPVVLNALPSVESWDSGDAVNQEIALYVVVANRLDVSVGI